MLSKCLAILALLGGLPALAQDPAASVPPPTTAIPMRHHGQMRVYDVPVPGAVQSPNWSGYAVTGTGFTKVLGSWIVPKIDCTNTPSSASYWVGIDGFPLTLTLERIGTEGRCYGGTPGYGAFYQFFPGNAYTIPITVSPGNKMSATVSYDGSKFTLKITNHTTGAHFFKIGSSLLASRTSAEWIVDADPFLNGTLPEFTRVSFGDDYTGVNDTNWATDSTITGPIADFGTRVQKITMVSSTGVTRAVPTALTTDGSSFKVTWKHR